MFNIESTFKSTHLRAHLFYSFQFGFWMVNFCGKRLNTIYSTAEVHWGGPTLIVLSEKKNHRHRVYWRIAELQRLQKRNDTCTSRRPNFQRLLMWQVSADPWEYIYSHFVHIVCVHNYKGGQLLGNDDGVKVNVWFMIYEKINLH